MCTLSWVMEDQGYHLFFNRDEHKSRTPAQPPKKFSNNGIHYLMPIDPVGKGSWIATNQFGVTIGLLNNYQGVTPDGELISRGQIVKQLAESRTLHDIRSEIEEMPLHRYAPFTVVIIIPSHPVLCYQWNGHGLHSIKATSPMVSSGVSLKEVTEYREAIFHSLVDQSENSTKLQAFHLHQHSDYGYLSVLMHRDDAQTVSMTSVEVNNRKITMKYHSIPVDKQEKMCQEPCQIIDRDFIK
ncbi:NRDE family protein [Aliivibrio kagoshimensis]|uniref:NRDE family protein n=1 Tax=Aliivibrio kagoshimensis TaxID=2910230 RepID=UPI003D0C741A